MALGGYRPGSGRKKGQRTIQSEKLKEFLVAEVMREKKPIIEALIQKAKQGDIAAIREVLERTLGKVKETLDLNAGESLNAVLLKTIEKIYGKGSNE